MNFLAWVQARDRNAVIVGVVCGPLLGLGIALATEPPQLVSGGPTGAFVAQPPRSSVGDAPVEPDDRTTVTASARPPSPRTKPPVQVARTASTEPTPPPTVAPTVTPPSPPPAPEDCINGEDE